MELPGTRRTLAEEEVTRKLVKKAYKGVYPSAAEYLISEGVASRPRQIEKALHWAYGMDIVYTLHGLTPANFAKYSDSLLLLAYQEAKRYDEYEYKYAGFDVKMYLTKGGRARRKGRKDVDIITLQAAMNKDPDVMVYGEEALGYATPQKYYLVNKVRDILDITQRYPEDVNKQKPYRVIKLFISIRERK